MSKQKMALPHYQEWLAFNKTPSLHIPKKLRLTKESKVFTIGSCFAQEIRTALLKRGYALFPDYLSVNFDTKTQVFDGLPERSFTAHYDTFTIRQEFETAFGVFSDRATSFLKVKDARINEKYNAPVLFQDPLRKVNYAATAEHLKDLASQIDGAMRTGVEQSDVYVITLGLTEVWQHNISGRHFCQSPYAGGGGGIGMATFRQSTFQENYDNVKAVLDMIFARYPQKHVILTVSPVPLGVTYSQTDIFTANLESKSILRAVAGQICRQYENAIYFPAYEIANLLAPTGQVFEADLRHVLPSFAEQVVNFFETVFGSE